MSFTSKPPEYYHAARYGAAVLNQPWNSGIVQLTGFDRLSWLQGMVTNDVEKLRPGEGTYAAHLNPQGKLIGQMTILVETDSVLLTMESANVKKLIDVMEPMVVMEDVITENKTGLLDSIAVLGPSAAAVLESWIGESLNLAALYQHRELSDNRRIVRDELGYTLWLEREVSGAALQGIVDAGATRIDEATWNVIRTEAGQPVYGTDIDLTTTLPELGGKGISYDKGCYIGQEVVARIKYLGHVNRRFMGFVCDGAGLPSPRSVVRSDGKEVGYTTSSVVSPGMGKAIALGFVNRAAAVAGTPVELESGDTRITATVSELPFMPFAIGSSD